jgi:hypothetical protein
MRHFLLISSCGDLELPKSELLRRPATIHIDAARAAAVHRIAMEGAASDVPLMRLME